MIINIMDKITGNDFYFAIFIIVLLVIIFLVIKSMRGNKEVNSVTIKKEVKEEIPIKEEIDNNKEQEEAKLELEKVVNKMSQADTNRPVKETTYEEEQEDKAIISYQELLAVSQGNKSSDKVNFDDIKGDYEVYENDGDIVSKLNQISKNKEVAKIPDVIVKDEEKEVTKEQPKIENNIFLEDKDIEEDLDESDIRSLLKEKSVLHVNQSNVSEKPLEYGSKIKDHEFKSSEFISPIHGTKDFSGEYFKKHEDIEIIDNVKPKEEFKYNDVDKTREIDRDFFKEVKEDELLDTSYMLDKEEEKQNYIPIEEEANEIISEDEEKPLSFGKISDRIENNDDFLDSLKNLRNSL